MKNSEVLRKVRMTKEAERLEEGLCPTCGGTTGSFRDKLSEKEFEISGMCQKCQDAIFGY